MNGLEIAIDRAGGTQEKLANLLGVRQTLVSYWLKVGRVPTKYLEDIESATGVAPSVIRPDLRNILAR